MANSDRSRFGAGLLSIGLILTGVGREVRSCLLAERSAVGYTVESSGGSVTRFGRRVLVITEDLLNWFRKPVQAVEGEVDSAAQAGREGTARSGTAVSNVGVSQPPSIPNTQIGRVTSEAMSSVSRRGAPNLANGVRAAEDTEEYKAANIIAIVPQEESAFMNVFGSQQSMSAAQEMNSVASAIRTIHSAGMISDVEHGVEALVTCIRNSSPRGPVVIFGHSVRNPRGATFIRFPGGSIPVMERVLRLPDGTPVHFEEISSICARERRECLVLTCYAPDFGLTESITFRESAQALQRASEQLARQRGTASSEDVVSEVRHQLRYGRFLRVVRYGAAVGGSGAVLIVATVEVQDAE